MVIPVIFTPAEEKKSPFLPKFSDLFRPGKFWVSAPRILKQQHTLGRWGRVSLTHTPFVIPAKGWGCYETSLRTVKSLQGGDFFPGCTVHSIQS